MGVLISRKFMIKKSMIMGAGFCSLVALILTCTAMGTPSWIVSEVCRTDVFVNGTCTPKEDNLLSVNYGLFSGTKSLYTLGLTTYSLNIYCDSTEGVCILSCGGNSDLRKKEFEAVRFNKQKYPCVPTNSRVSAKRDIQPVVPDNQFVQYGLWISTIVFLSFTIAFQLVAVGVSGLNIATVPAETWLGPAGIYLANAISVLTNLITLAIWGDLYNSNLSSEIAIQETILDEYTSGSTSLGYSYWLVFVALTLNIVSCVFVRFRNAVRNYTEAQQEGTVVDENAPPKGVILLY